MQGVTGLVRGLSDIAVELRMLPLAHILGVHQPDCLQVDMQRDAVSKMHAPNNRKELAGLLERVGRATDQPCGTVCVGGEVPTKTPRELQNKCPLPSTGHQEGLAWRTCMGLQDVTKRLSKWTKKRGLVMEQNLNVKRCRTLTQVHTDEPGSAVGRSQTRKATVFDSTDVKCPGQAHQWLSGLWEGRQGATGNTGRFLFGVRMF